MFQTVDGYYTVKIRGHSVTVWCVMTGTFAATYTNITASNRWGGSASNIIPQSSVTVTITRARIRFDNCIIVLGRTDTTFADVEMPEGSDDAAHNSRCEYFL